MAAAATRAKGTVTQVLGNVVDIEFPNDQIPDILSLIHI